MTPKNANVALYLLDMLTEAYCYIFSSTNRSTFTCLVLETHLMTVHLYLHLSGSNKLGLEQKYHHFLNW